jgi:hypothetical protein
MVQLATKACLRPCCWGIHTRIGSPHKACPLPRSQVKRMNSWDEKVSTRFKGVIQNSWSFHNLGLELQATSSRLGANAPRVKDASKIFNEISRCSSVGCSLGFPRLSKALTQVTLSTQLKDMALQAWISLREVGESFAMVLEGLWVGRTNNPSKRSSWV